MQLQTVLVSCFRHFVTFSAVDNYGQASLSGAGRTFSEYEASETTIVPQVQPLLRSEVKDEDEDEDDIEERMMKALDDDEARGSKVSHSNLRYIIFEKRNFIFTNNISKNGLSCYWLIGY